MVYQAGPRSGARGIRRWFYGGLAQSEANCVVHHRSGMVVLRVRARCCGITLPERNGPSRIRGRRDFHRSGVKLQICEKTRRPISTLNPPGCCGPVNYFSSLRCVRDAHPWVKYITSSAGTAVHRGFNLPPDGLATPNVILSRASPQSLSPPIILYYIKWQVRCCFQATTSWATLACN